MHLFQHGIGIRIVADQDRYALALLDGAFGDFFVSHTESPDEGEQG
jgi:hypothetical protein